MNNDTVSLMYSSPVNFVQYFDGFHQPVLHSFPANFIVPSAAILLYLAFVYWGQKWMKGKEPYKMTTFLKFWNLGMSILSLFMCLGLGLPVLALSIKQGLFEDPLHAIYMATCAPDMVVWVGPQVFWGWVFAWSKFLEMGDTVLLVLRKRKVIFLHWYHHTTVLAYTWFSLAVMNPTSGFFAPINAIIHVFLYYYYYAATNGHRPWWGKFLTQAQLLQMVLGFSISVLWSYYYLSGAVCPQEFPYLLIGSTSLLYGSYFFLFFWMYLQRWATHEPKTKDE